mmetsp:Transcript_44234/g.128017  ORF Transcript_44234/g.128017 Transcript_44234/m.128017 type:complete len:332 (-) Transcript_44234:70-1065(-)
MSPKKETRGVALVMVSSVFVSANLFASKLIKSKNWPYFHTMGIVCWLIALSSGLALLFSTGRQGFHCGTHTAKWVFLRGSFGTGRFVLGIAAALAGCPPGDVAALGSINTVVAALLGRVFLLEALGWPSICGVGLSIVGAALISDPWAETGPEAGPHSRGTTWLGFTLALVAGTSMGCLFIASRKTPGASPWLMTVSAMGQQGAVWWLLAAVLVLVAALAFVTFMGSFLASAGSKLCPAAISATAYTATSLAMNYAGQILIFEQHPKALTIAGAFAMLLAVVATSLDRLLANGSRGALLEPLAGSGSRRWRRLAIALRLAEPNGEWSGLAL